MVSKSAEILTADLAQSSATQPGCAGPTTGTETILAGVLADVMHAERVPADSNFFDDLGADSMLMAQFCARVRKRGDLPPVSMKDIYRHPTIRSLATALADAAPAPAGSPVPAPAEVAVPAPAGVAAPASTRQYVLCGTLQFLFFLGYAWVAALVGARAYEWISAGSGFVDIYLRAVLFGGAGFVGAVHPSDPGEVGADRPVEAPADPHLEPGVRPLLDRQDAGPVEPAGLPVRRFAAVCALSEGAGRQGRAQAPRSSPGMCPCAPTC